MSFAVPADCQEIMNAHKEPVGNTILGNSFQTRAMLNRDLAHLKTMNLAQGRQETMKPFEHNEMHKNISFEGAKRASGVLDPILQNQIPDFIGNDGRDAPDNIIPPFHPDPAYHIAVFELLKEQGDIARIVLQITIQGNQDPSCA